MKRVLALVLALVMIIAPMSVFATTDNTVNKVPKVADDKDYAGSSSAPVLRLEENNVGDFTTNSTFRLTLEGAGAEWNYGKTTVTENVYNTFKDTADNTTVTGAYVQVRKLTDTVIDVTMKAVPSTASNKMALVFPMNVKLDGTGEAKVVVDPRDSVISGGTYTYAVAGKGATVATVADSVNIQRGNNETGADIIIDETNIGALSGTQKFRVKLPNNFEWNKSMETLTNGYITATGGSYLSVTKAEVNGRDLDITLNAGNTTTSDTDNVRRTITIKPHINVTRDADFGDINVIIDGQSSDVSDESGLLIGTYSDYGVAITIPTVKEMVAGKLNGDDNYYTDKIKIKENIANSLLEGRTIDFTLPDWVKLVDANDNGTLADDIKITDDKNVSISSTNDIKVDEKGSQFDITMHPTSTKNKAEFKLELPITVKANESGDVDLTVSGAGIEEQTLTVAKAIAPVTTKIDTTDVKIGLQDQPAPDITITENVAGALKEKKDLKVWFKDSYGFNFDDATFTVTNGDLELDQDNDHTSGDYLGIRIKSESTEPSTIKISGIKMTLDRTVPEGPFDVRVGGDALVENYIDPTVSGFKYTDTPYLSQYNTSGSSSSMSAAEYNTTYLADDLTSRVAQATLANVVTRAGGTVATEAKFVIGQPTYTTLLNSEEVQKTMDVAAFIENGRTMLPVRFVADALGVKDQDIVWNGAARTVTIFKGNRIIQLTIDKYQMLVNGTPVMMDSPAIIKDGRTFLPVRFVAQALGANISWDEATRTVTIEQ